MTIKVVWLSIDKNVYSSYNKTAEKTCVLRVVLASLVLINNKLIGYGIKPLKTRILYPNPVLAELQRFSQ